MYQDESFNIRGKTVRMARQLKGINARSFANIAGINLDHLIKMEREERRITRLSEIRIIRSLRKDLGVTDAQIVALQIIIEDEEGKFDK